MIAASNPTVLVTGASGFIAMHCVLQLLEQGYRVRGTLRSLSREPYLRDIFSSKVQIDGRLEFVQADLTKDDGWERATEGCEYVLHLASPFPAVAPEDENDLIIPAKEGTLRVLNASQASGVSRVVLTSSVVAVWLGHTNYGKTFDERDWSNLDGKIDAYAKSKTIAEQAAWEFIKKQDSEIPMGLSVINPGFVLGPLLDGTHVGTSADVIRNMMIGAYPGNPIYMLAIVDVRDVAAAHLMAMTTPAANGNRYICAAQSIWFVEMAQILARNFADRGYKISTRQIPVFLTRLFSYVDKSARGIVNDLGHEIRFSNQRIIEDLNWKPRSAEEAIVAMAESLIQHGLV